MTTRRKSSLSAWAPAFVALGSMLIFSAGPVFAESPSGVDFDKEIDATRIVRELGTWRLAPLATDFIEVKIPVLPSLRLLRNASASGYILYQFRAEFMRTEPTFQEAVGLRQDRRYKTLPAPVLKPLDLKWPDIQRVRDALLDDTRGLDQRDEAMKAEEDALLEIQKDLNGRALILQSDILDFSKRCAGTDGRVLTPAERATCIAQRPPLVRRQDELIAERAALNDRINSFKATHAVLANDAGVWSGKAEAWFGKLENLIQEIKDALKSWTMTCDEMQSEMHKICDENGQWSCKGDQACEQLKINLAKALACHKARKELMDVCFDGGDDDHKEHLQEVQNSIDNCRRWIGRTCGAGVSSGAPW